MSGAGKQNGLSLPRAARFFHSCRIPGGRALEMRRLMFGLPKFVLTLVVAAAIAVALLTLLPATNGASAAPRLSPQPPARKSRASQLLAEGTALLEQGDEAAAKERFRRALAADPGNAMAHTYLGALADRAGELGEAEKHFAAAAKSAPSLPSARNNYGAILLRLNRVPEAAAQFAASLKLDARQVSALVNLARIHARAGTPADLRRARELFERARAVAPDAEIALSLTLIALRLDDRAAAANYYRDYAAAVVVATARDSSGTLPGAAAATTATARAELGAALLEVKLFEEAAAELSHAVAVEPSNVKWLINLARAERGRGETAAAGRLLEGAVARGLDAAPIYAALADLYESIGRAENAIPALRLAVERDPRSEIYRFRYALLLIDTQAPKAAIIRLEEALPQFPRSARLWFALGLAHLTAHQNDEAVRALARVVELDPKAAPALAYLGLAHADEGRQAEALAFYERALAVDERVAVAHYLLADLLLKQSSGDPARVETHLKRAVTLDPTLTSARLALAKVYVRAERWTEAVGELERAVGLDPNLAEAHYQLGRAYTRLKRTAEAQTAFATFKRLSETQKAETQIERRELVRRLANVRF